MSIVITAWDKSVGIALCDGRAIDSEKNPVHEDHSKLSRLPNGCILGITGGLREGHTTTTLTGMVTEPLRRDIHAVAGTFPEVCDSIGHLLAAYRVKYPELAFGISLIGNDGGTIRSASWTSGGETDRYAPDVDADTCTNVLGLSATANEESAKLIREYMAGVPRNFIDLADTYQALKRIIEDMSQRHVELNDHVYCEFIAAPGERAVLDWRTQFADGSSLNTASRVLTSTATGTYLVTTTYPQAIPGLGWTVTTAGAGDTYNIDAAIRVTVPLGSNASSWAAESLLFQAYIDGRPSTMSNLWPVGMLDSVTVVNLTVIGSITGLAAGTHTIQLYVGGGVSGAHALGTSFALCQRIF